jgi:septum formation protein
MLLSYSARLRAREVRIVLASSSPRRQQLIALLLPSVAILVRPSTFAEDLPHAAYTPAEYAVATSRAKAVEVWAKGEADVLISADTVVVRDEAILEKPASE